MKKYIRALIACLLLLLVLGAAIPAAAPARADSGPVTGGYLFAWGWNAYGELGNGSTDDSNTPVPVSNLNRVTAVEAGGGHSLALKDDGTVWTWGWNAFGELGNGTWGGESDVPLQVSGISGTFISIAAGDLYCLALDSDGNVWAWGGNQWGQLGNGNTTNNSTPTQVSGISGITAISAGWYHSLALKDDGTVWAWGCNRFGELGNGNDLPPENESSLMIDWGIRKGALDGQEILHTGTDYQQASGG